MTKYVLIVGNVDAQHLNFALLDFVRDGLVVNLHEITADRPSYTQICAEAALSTAAIEPLPANPGEEYADRIARREQELVKAALGDINPDDIVASLWESEEVNFDLGWLVNALPQGHHEYVIDTNNKLVLYSGLTTA